MNICQDCVFLSSNVVGQYICQRPDGTGNYKSHPYVGACSQFKEKKGR